MRGSEGAESEDEIEVEHRAERGAGAASLPNTAFLAGLSPEERLTADSLTETLREFRRAEWPVWRQFGFTFVQAFQSAQFNNLFHALREATEPVDDAGDEPWKG